MRLKLSIVAGISLTCLGAVLPSAGSAAPSQRLRSVPAASTLGSKAVFLLDKVPSRRIVSAKIRVGHRTRVLPVRAVRRAARRGRPPSTFTAPRRRRPSRCWLSLSRPPLPQPLASSTRARVPGIRRSRRIPDIDPGSPEMVATLVGARAEKGFPIALREWTVPVYYATAGTPRYTVSLRTPPSSWANAYGTPDGYGAAPPGWRTDPWPVGPADVPD